MVNNLKYVNKIEVLYNEIGQLLTRTNCDNDSQE